MWISEGRPGSTAVEAEDGTTITRGELSRIAESFRAIAGRGDLVVDLCENSLGGVAGYAGLLEAGCAQLMLDSDVRPASLQRLMEIYRPRFAWVPSARREEFATFPVRIELRGHALHELREESPHLHPELALLLTTSGSTGSPKFVRLSRENLRANADSIARYLEIGTEERAPTTLSMAYSYGLSVVNSHLLAGATVLATSASIAQRPFWDIMRDRKATSFAGVPFSFEILEKVGFRKLELPSLRTLTQAGGRLDPSLQVKLAQHCRQRGMRLFVMYGQTEATARISYLPPEFAEERTDCIGKAVPGGTIEIVDSAGDAIHASGVVGEIRYAGPNVAMGYAQSAHDLALGSTFGGAILTGDRGFVDDDGFFHVAGRTRRIVKLHGSRISLDEVETICREIGFTAACTGSDKGLVLHVAAESSAAGLAKDVAGRLRIPPSCVIAREVAEMPRTISGKIDYARLEAEA